MDDATEQRLLKAIWNIRWELQELEALVDSQYSAKYSESVRVYETCKQLLAAGRSMPSAAFWKLLKKLGAPGQTLNALAHVRYIRFLTGNYVVLTDKGQRLVDPRGARSPRVK